MQGQSLYRPPRETRFFNKRSCLVALVYLLVRLGRRDPRERDSSTHRGRPHKSQQSSRIPLPKINYSFAKKSIY